MAVITGKVLGVTAKQMYRIQAAGLQDKTPRATSVSWGRQGTPWLLRAGFTGSHNLVSDCHLRLTTSTMTNGEKERKRKLFIALFLCFFTDP